LNRLEDRSKNLLTIMSSQSQTEETLKVQLMVTTVTITSPKGMASCKRAPRKIWWNNSPQFSNQREKILQPWMDLVRMDGDPVLHHLDRRKFMLRMLALMILVEMSKNLLTKMSSQSQLLETLKVQLMVSTEMITSLKGMASCKRALNLIW